MRALEILKGVSVKQLQSGAIKTK